MRNNFEQLTLHVVGKEDLEMLTALPEGVISFGEADLVVGTC